MSPDSCKDVDTVSSPADCSSSSETGREPQSKNRSISNSRGTRSQEEDSVDSDNMASSVFEFQKAGARTATKQPQPFSKPAPSKWDNAQKWIASPTVSRSVKGGMRGKKGGGVGCGNRMAATKVVVEVAAEPDTKRIDPSQAKIEGVGLRGMNCVPVVESSFADADVNLNQDDSSRYTQSATALIQHPSTVKCAVPMRDMGTEMTPVASGDPSRSATPIRATELIRSFTSSRASSPGRIAPTSTPVEFVNYHGGPNRNELSERELQMKTRREIMLLGAKLGKPGIAAWASREEEEQDASRSLNLVSVDPPEQSAIEIRASAWEEAEKAKYLARFKQEEIKIQAWENHQMAKAEAEMRKVEVEVERVRVHADKKLLKKLSDLRQKAEEKRIAAEAKLNRQAAKTAKQVEYIRQTGKMPSSCFCCGWCSENSNIRCLPCFWL